MSIFRFIYNLLSDAIQGIVIGGAIAVFIYALIMQPHEVSGASMHPTLKDKEYVLTSLVHKHFNNIHKGDIIVFHPPVETEKNFIKRVIASSGDTIRIENGDVYVNDTHLDESSYLNASVRTFGGTFLPDGKSVTIPADSYFVMGDNRSFSSDSREWGLLPKDKIIGKTLVRAWPLMEFTIL